MAGKFIKILTAAFFGMAAPMAQAATITIDFTGVVSGVDFPEVFDEDLVAGLVASDVMAGDSVTGQIIIDDAAPQVFGAPGFASYDPVDALVDLVIGVRSYRSTQVQVQVTNDSAFVGDVFRVQGFTPDGPAFAGNAPGRVQFTLGSAQADIIDGTEHPDADGVRAFVAANEIGGRQNFVSFGSPLAQGGTYRFDLTSVVVSSPDVAQVSLPASAGLLAGGLIVFGAMGRRRK